jgi:hypothetical protein
MTRTGFGNAVCRLACCAVVGALVVVMFWLGAIVNGNLEMEVNINPYESPRVGESMKEQPMGDADSVRQILIEIRDGQRELLQLQRETLARARGMRPFSFVMMAISLVVMISIPLLSFMRIRALPVPVRPAPRVAPLPGAKVTEAMRQDGRGVSE